MARPKKPAPAHAAGAISTKVLQITGKRVGGVWNRGQLIRVGTGEGECTPELAESLIAKGLAIWNGDRTGHIDAAARQRQAAVKSAAEAEMQRFDQMDPEDRAFERGRDPDEGDDVI